MGPHDLESYRHQMSAYLSNALTGSINRTNSDNDHRSQISVPPPHFIPFLMGRIDEKLLTRLPTTATHSNLDLLYPPPPPPLPLPLPLPPSLSSSYHHHSIQTSNINTSSASPASSSSSSNSSVSDTHEDASPYLTTFDHHQRIKLEIQDTTA